MRGRPLRSSLRDHRKWSLLSFVEETSEPQQSYFLHDPSCIICVQSCSQITVEECWCQSTHGSGLWQNTTVSDRGKISHERVYNSQLSDKSNHPNCNHEAAEAKVKGFLARPNRKPLKWRSVIFKLCAIASLQYLLTKGLKTKGASWWKNLHTFACIFKWALIYRHLPELCLLMICLDR